MLSRSIGSNCFPASDFLYVYDYSGTEMTYIKETGFFLSTYFIVCPPWDRCLLYFSHHQSHQFHLVPKGRQTDVCLCFSIKQILPYRSPQSDDRALSLLWNLRVLCGILQVTLLQSVLNLSHLSIGSLKAEGDPVSIQSLRDAELHP